MNFRVAVLQMKSRKNALKENTDLVLQNMVEAKAKGADILLLPECFLTSYELPIYNEDALELSDPYIEEIRRAAAEIEIGVVVTAALRGKHGPRNSALLIDKEGKLLMNYAKVHTCDFADEKYFESGDSFYVCDFHGVKLGIMICFDREYPESARVLMLKGAELILLPNDCGCMKPRLNALSTRAYENMVGVVMANAPGENAGASCAFSPICWDKEGLPVDNGLLLAGELEEGLFFVDFDMDAIRDYRSREMMGNTFRKVKAYEELLFANLREPFLRRGQGKYNLPYEIKTREDYKDILGKKVSGIIDRPLGSRHPRRPEMKYLINYGYVEDVIAGDGAYQDVYFLNSYEPLEVFEGIVVAVLHRYDDVEDKWIAIPEDTEVPGELEIMKAIYDQERYFTGTLIM